ncbi:MAG: chaperonin GroEL, partial [Phycisphaeraceae bacterium]|nr:chaperonin GroEL [Phycisphaeraceae bacterium]
AAAAEGYVPGGGVALIRAGQALADSRKKAKGDEKLGFDIAIAALDAPLRQIVQNAGEDGYLVVEEVKNATGNKGYNAATSKYVDMVRAGIIDPARVAKTALTSAASVSGLMLTTNVLITDAKDDEVTLDGAIS